MAITNNLKKVIDLNYWEPCNILPLSAAPSYSNAAIDSRTEDWGPVYISKDSLNPRYQYFLTNRGGVFNIFMYDVEEDASILIPFGESLAGASMSILHHPIGPSGTAVTGTVSSISTGLNFQTDCRGFKVRILSGPGAGEERVISKNVVGDLTSTSGTLYVTEPFSQAITNQSVFQLYTGSIFYNIGNGNPMFKRIDLLTNTVTTLTTPPSPFSGGISFTYESSMNIMEDIFDVYLSANATSWGVSSITTTGKTWSNDNFTNYQIRLTSGTGAGQIRNIVSSTSDTIHVSPSWDTQPSSNTQYVVEPNLDIIYFRYGGEVYSAVWSKSLRLQKYNITTNSFTIMEPLYQDSRVSSLYFSLSTISYYGWTQSHGFFINDTINSTEDLITKNKHIYHGVYSNNIFKQSISTGVVDFSNRIYPSSVLLIGTGTPSNTPAPLGELSDMIYNKGKIYMVKWHARYAFPAASKFFQFDMNANILKAIATFYQPTGGHWKSVNNLNTSFIYNYTEGGTILSYYYFLPFGTNQLYRLLLK